MKGMGFNESMKWGLLSLSLARLKVIRGNHIVPRGGIDARE